MVVILCGKSGSGKDWVGRGLRGKFGFEILISTTSRPIRENEKDGVDYNFVTKEQFLDKVKNDEMLEYRSYNTLFKGQPDIWYYGTPKKDLDPTKNYVIVLDLEGAKKFKEYYKDKTMCICAYIKCPDEIRMKRAQARGSFDLIEWNRRLEADKIDFSDDKIIEVCDKIVDNSTEKDVDFCWEV